MPEDEKLEESAMGRVAAFGLLIIGSAISISILGPIFYFLGGDFVVETLGETGFWAIIIGSFVAAWPIWSRVKQRSWVY